MALKKSHGNMYDWVTHMHTHLAGECPHRCKYCYVQTNPYVVSSRWKGKLTLIENELGVDYSKRWWDETSKIWKTEKIIFIEHMSDIFAEGIPDVWIKSIINHCWIYPENTYVFQTKNPWRAMHFFKKFLFPDDFMMGTTIETNREYKDSKAPLPIDRYEGMVAFRKSFIKTFVTVEPIMDFDVDILVGWLIDIKPDFVYIGADSKKCNLSEPSASKIKELISALKTNKIHIKKKNNLNRLLPKER